MRVVIGDEGERRPAVAKYINKGGEFVYVDVRLNYGNIDKISIALDPETLARIVRVALTGEADNGVRPEPKISN